MTEAKAAPMRHLFKATATAGLRGQVHTELSPAGAGSARRIRAVAPLFASALALLPVQAKAQLSAEETAILRRVAAVVSVDLSQAHIGNERAILLIDEVAEVADLVIMAGQSDDAAGQALIVARGLVWAGQMPGQEPSLAVDPDGSLIVHAQQTAIGRMIWEETLTISEHEGNLLISGYKLTSSDRVTSSEGQCDWRLVSGQWTSTANQPTGEVMTLSGQQPQTVALTDWSAQGDKLPEFCRFDFEE